MSEKDNHIMPETKEAPERIRLLRDGSSFRSEWYYLDAAVSKHAGEVVYVPKAELDAAVEQARDESDARAEGLNEYFCYWLLRAYQSGHREGWEEGPSVAQTMTDLLNVLSNCGFDPSGAAAKELLKKKMAYFLQAAAKEKRDE